MKSEDVAEALRRDLIRKPEAPAGIFMTEVGSPDGKRRADALFLPAVGGQGIIGHEIKVSRSDVLTELADPHKAESWKQYCNRWWLVVSDASLVTGLDIPSDWGIKCPPTAANRRAFTIIRQAPKLDPHPLGPALSRIATVWAYKQHSQEWAQRNHAGEVARLNERITELTGKLSAAGLDAQPDANQEAAVTLIAALRARNRYVYLPRDLEQLADTIIEAQEVINLRKMVAGAFDQKWRSINAALESIRKDDFHIKRILQVLKEPEQQPA